MLQQELLDQVQDAYQEWRHAFDVHGESSEPEKLAKVEYELAVIQAKRGPDPRISTLTVEARCNKTGEILRITRQARGPSYAAWAACANDLTKLFGSTDWTVLS